MRTPRPPLSPAERASLLIVTKPEHPNPYHDALVRDVIRDLLDEMEHDRIVTPVDPFPLTRDPGAAEDEELLDYLRGR